MSLVRLSKIQVDYGEIVNLFMLRFDLQMDQLKDFVQHEVNLGYCYAEYLFFDLFRNRQTYGFTFFGNQLANIAGRRGDNSENDPHSDSFFLAFWRFLGRLRREGVATPIVSFLRAAVRDIGMGANRLIWKGRRKQGKRKHRRVDRSVHSKNTKSVRKSQDSKWWQFWKRRRNSHKRNPSFLQALKRVLSSVLTENKALSRRSGHSHGHSHDHSYNEQAVREALSSNLRPFAVGPLSTFLDYMLKSNSPDSGFYCLKNYVSRKMYFWLGKGLKSFLFT